jgi:hypothetical protein
MASTRLMTAALGRDDVEVRVERIHQLGEGRDYGLVAVQLDLPGLGELTGCGGL